MLPPAVVLAVDEPFLRSLAVKPIDPEARSHRAGLRREIGRERQRATQDLSAADVGHELVEVVVT